MRDFITKLGLDASKYSGHSFRRGVTQLDFSINTDISTLMIVGNWKSDAILAYLDNKLDARKESLYTHQSIRVNGSMS